MKTPFRKRLAAILTALTVLVASGAVGLTVLAASTVTVQIANIPREADKQYSNGNWGHPELKLMNGWTIHKETYFTVKILDDYDTGDAVYCIEPASSLHTGDELSKQSAAEKFFESNVPYNGTLNGDWQRKLVAAILYNGYQGTCNLSTWLTQNASGTKDLAKYWATQILVWEAIIGERDPNFDRVSVPSGYVSIDTFVMDGNPIRSEILSAMSDIESKVKATLLSPSFVEQDERKQQTFTLTYDSASKKYKAELTDTNNVLGNWNFSAPGLTTTVSGNKLTITSDKALDETVTLTATRENTSSSSLVVWGDGVYTKDGSAKQDLVAYGSPLSETLTAWAKLETEEMPTGSLQLTKVDKDYPENKLTGGEFTVYDIDGKTVGTMTEGEPGEYTMTDLPLGTYTVKETKTPTGFLPDTKSYEVTISKADEVVTVYNDAESRAFVNERSTTKPTTEPTTKPTTEPTTKPTTEPTTKPTTEPTTKPTTEPTTKPTTKPTTQPTTKPTTEPTTKPTTEPTTKPTTEPTTKPTTEPTTKPTTEPTTKPTTEPTTKPTTKPTTEPTTKPTTEPTTKPTTQPTTKPTTEPTTKPTTEPTTKPTTEPTTKPTTEPTTKPTTEPTTKPTTEPTTESTTTTTTVCHTPTSSTTKTSTTTTTTTTTTTEPNVSVPKTTTTPSTTKKAKTVVDTGDPAKPVLFIVLAGVAAVCGIVVCVVKRRENR